MLVLVLALYAKAYRRYSQVQLDRDSVLGSASSCLSLDGYPTFQLFFSHAIKVSAVQQLPGKVDCGIFATA